MERYEEQRVWIDAVVEEAKVFPVDQKYIEYLEELLDNINKYLRPCKVQYQDGRIGVSWNFDETIVSVLFGPGDNWEYTAISVYDTNYQHYTIQYTSEGNIGSTYVVGGRNYYHLPETIEKLITLPDTFSKEYTPMLENYQHKTVWVTNVYDGPLSGYCRLQDGRLYYFDYVEETDYERNRMFAVYQLSWWERLRIWVHYFKWHASLHNSFLWWLHGFRWFRSLRSESVEEHWAKKAKFEKEHKIVGYYEG